MILPYIKEQAPSKPLDNPMLGYKDKDKDKDIL